MSLTISDDAMKSVMASAILQAITKEEREKLIQAALESLLTEKETNYPYKTKLSRVFDDAVHVFARKHVEEMLRGDEVFKTKLREVLNKGIEGVLAGIETKIHDAVSNIITKAFERSF